MSDDLDLNRVVDARIDSYRPETVPPFDAIVSRKRGRDRRRLAAGGGALSVLAVTGAVALAVVGPSQPGDERLAGPATAAPDQRAGGPSCEERSVDSPPDSAISWSHYLRWQDRVYTADDDAPDAVAVGEQLGTVTCKRSGSLTPVDHVIADGEAAFLEPGTPFHTIEGRSPDEAITALFNGRQLVFAFDAAQTAELAEAQRPSTDVLRVRTDGTTGATVCKAETAVDFPDKQCRLLGKDAADRLAAALNGAQPYGRAPLCQDDGPVYKILFDHPAARMIPIVVPTACGPITVGQQRYRINDRIVRAVTAEHDAEADHGELISRCVGNEQAAPAPEYVGLTEAEANTAKAQAPPVRVVGRDATCLGRDDDLRNDRVNLIIADGKVVWAGRF